MAGNALLTIEQMYKADALAEQGGVPSLTLMEAAGEAIAEEIPNRWAKRQVVVLAGPGNNGGDGFVVARLLDEADWPVRVAVLGDVDTLTGDAAVNAERWQGETEVLSPDLLPDLLADNPLIVDALFGAGLSRPLAGTALAFVQAVNDRNLDCIAVDIPSGVIGDSGEMPGGKGSALKATVTVTFFRAKTGHFLLPGREQCGQLVVADIGIPESVLEDINPKIFHNGPSLWLGNFPWPEGAGHKYDRGHAVVCGGSEMTGAARLAGLGARRMGAGLVTIAAPSSTFTIYAKEEPGTLVKAVDDDADFRELIGDPRISAVLAGPGLGVSEATRERVLSLLSSGKATVLDADALSAFAGDPETLFGAINGPCLMTPHEGEFNRLFAIEGDKLTRTRRAAEVSGAVVLFKGADTVIADPDGNLVINAHASPDLATAGSGDVLAGMALGLIAQGMTPFQAGCASAWIHGAAGAKTGPGLIAEDLPANLPSVLRDLKITVS
ncbi:MAG: NAD(P)H-hydrate dehydratase [Alphaproteobacteria bacterium]|jgi:ADP-dependent NAD(P)H-hydrate dehydratase / NAD(P)H-hydrate epimerase|nr:NAD(P)H-hydrate dehydratase [Alphaproteobacteria bacterium]